MNEAADEATIKARGTDEQAVQFNMRKQISSTTYEVAVYFSRTSRETLDDKILRLAQSEALNGDEGQ